MTSPVRSKGPLCRFAIYACLAAGAGVPSWGASITSLAPPGGGPFILYEITGATPDASVLVGWASHGEEQRPIRWTPAGGIEDLGSLPGRGPGGEALAVSADGSTVVGWSGVFRTAFRWTESSGMQEIVTGLQIGQDSVATAVSADGSVVAGNFFVSEVPEAFRWTAGAGWSRLIPNPRRGESTTARAVSADGTVVVGEYDHGTNALFRWTETDGLQTIPEDPASFPFLGDVTPDASVLVGTRVFEGRFLAYRWTQSSGLRDLLPPPVAEYESSHAYSVSDDGKVVAGASRNGSTEGFFLWTEEEGPQVFETQWPPGDLLPQWISGDGSRVVGVIGFPEDFEPLTRGPWIWDREHGLRLLEDELGKHYGLDLEGRRLGYAAGISFDGSTIFGVGVSSSGEEGVYPWIARLDGCRDTQEEAIIAGAPPGPQDPAVHVVLDSSAAGPGRGDEDETISRSWSIVSGPAAITGPLDGPTVEVQATGLGSAVVRLAVDDGVCANPASSLATIRFCDVRRARNAMFVGRCDVVPLEGAAPLPPFLPRLSADGSVILGRRRPDERRGGEATRWTLEGGEMGLGDLPLGDMESHPTGLSADGSVIVGVGHTGSHAHEVFVWSEEDGMRGLGVQSSGHFLPEPGVAVSSDGSFVAWNGGGLLQYWTEAGGIQRFGLYSFVEGYVVRGASDDGSFLLVQDEVLALRVPKDSMPRAIFDLTGGETFTVGNDISSDGSTIVGRSGSALGTEAFRWTAVWGSIGLGDLPGGEFSSEAHAMTADGSIVVGRGFGVEGPEAFIWDGERGMRSLGEVLAGDFGLDVTGWKLEAAYDISADGLTLVGAGVDPSGTPQTWLARLDLCGDPPEIARIDGAPAEPVSTGEPVTLDGSRSATWPGEGNPILSYRWEVIAGDGSIAGAADEPVARVQASVPGAVRVRLSVDDGGCGGRPGADEVELVFREPSPGTWILGDANGDSSIDISDAVHTLNHLFGGGPEAECLESTDCNSDGLRDISDPVYLLSYLFTGGAPPAAPYPDCEVFPACGDSCP